MLTCPLFPAITGGAEQRQTQLGTPERGTACAHHRRGHAQPLRAQDHQGCRGSEKVISAFGKITFCLDCLS